MSAQHKDPMPPLPDPKYKRDAEFKATAFTADQMHAYARAYAADRDARIAELERCATRDAGFLDEYEALFRRISEIAGAPDRRTAEGLLAAVTALAARQPVEAEPVAWRIHSVAAGMEPPEGHEPTIAQSLEIAEGRVRELKDFGGWSDAWMEPLCIAAQQPATVKADPVLDCQYSTDGGQTWTWSTDGKAEVKGWCTLLVRYYGPAAKQHDTVMREVTDGQILESACAMLSLAFDEKDVIDFGRDVLRKARPILAQQGQES